MFNVFLSRSFRGIWGYASAMPLETGGWVRLRNIPVRRNLIAAPLSALCKTRRFRVKGSYSGVTSEVMIVNLVVKCAFDALYKLQHNARLPWSISPFRFLITRILYAAATVCSIRALWKTNTIIWYCRFFWNFAPFVTDFYTFFTCSSYNAPDLAPIAAKNGGESS